MVPDWPSGETGETGETWLGSGPERVVSESSTASRVRALERYGLAPLLLLVCLRVGKSCGADAVAYVFRRGLLGTDLENPGEMIGEYL